MHQSALAFAPQNPSPPPCADRTGFQIGWDHAQHGLVPEPGLLLEGTAVGQGWRAGRAVLGHRPPLSTPALRQWLALRCSAWQEGVDFDLEQLTPAALAGLQTGYCPVRRRPLGGALVGEDALQVVMLDRAAAYRPGNLVMLSRAAADAARAAPGCSPAQALRQARSAEATGLAVLGLQGAQWRRLAVLLSFAQPWSPAEAARLPLLVLPPPGVAPRSSVQALQWVLTLHFSHPGWSSRARALAAALPQDAQRTDFHLFVSALASRVLDAGTDTRAEDTAARGAPAAAEPAPSRLENSRLENTRLEDAWQHERVLQRWQQLVLGLGDTACHALLARARALLPQPGRATRSPARHAAVIPHRCAAEPRAERAAALPAQPSTAPRASAAPAHGDWAAVRPSLRRRPPALAPLRAQA